MWMSLDFIANSLDGDGNIDFNVDFDKYDLNGDNEINARDCPFVPGSAEAKLWFHNVLQPYVQSQVTPELQAKHGDGLVGVYKGKPLIPGSAGPGEGDFRFLVDKIRVTQGLSYSSAVKIAGKVKAWKYGG